MDNKIIKIKSTEKGGGPWEKNLGKYVGGAKNYNKINSTENFPIFPILGAKTIG